MGGYKRYPRNYSEYERDYNGHQRVYKRGYRKRHKLKHIRNKIIGLLILLTLVFCLGIAFTVRYKLYLHL